MKTIYEQALERIGNGARFNVDFKRRNLSINGKRIVKDGIYDGEFGIDLAENPLFKVKELYLRYRHSLPSERSDQKRKLYFKALPEKYLTDEDMAYGLSREYARAALEIYVLGWIIEHPLKWDYFAAGKWYWQCPECPSLILRQDWFESNKK